MDTSTLLLWTYVALMAAGALLFTTWSRDPRGVPAYAYSIATFVPIWSGLAYLGMSLGQGTVEVAGRTVYFARYLDWVVTTPLILLALALTATLYVPKAERPLGLILSLIGADVVMIVCGLVADLSVGVARAVWYVAGTGAFAAVLYLVWGPLERVARRSEGDAARAYKRLATFLTVLWFCYPAIWALGSSGLGVLAPTVETALFVVVPFLSKVGFSFLDLRAQRALVAARPVTV